MSRYERSQLSADETAEDSPQPGDEVVLARLERVLRMVRLLQSGQSYTSSDLAEQFGVGQRTIFRDIRMLRECGIAIDSVPRGGYRLDGDVFQRPAQATARDIALMALGVHLVRGSAETGLEKILHEAIDKLLGVRSGTAEERLNEFDRMFDIVDVSAIGEVPNVPWLAILIECLAYESPVRIWTSSARRSNSTLRQIIPRQLKIASGGWWLLSNEVSGSPQELIDLRQIEILESVRPHQQQKRHHF